MGQRTNDLDAPNYFYQKVASVDAVWDLELTDPGPINGGSITAGLDILNFVIVDAVLMTADFSNLVNSSRTIAFSGGTVDIQFLSPTLAAGSAGFVTNNVWLLRDPNKEFLNEDSLTSVLNLNARLTYTPNLVPEPSSLLCFGTGALGISLISGRRRRRSYPNPLQDTMSGKQDSIQ